MWWWITAYIVSFSTLFIALIIIHAISDNGPHWLRLWSARLLIVLTLPAFILLVLAHRFWIEVRWIPFYLWNDLRSEMTAVRSTWKTGKFTKEEYDPHDWI